MAPHEWDITLGELAALHLLERWKELWKIPREVKGKWRGKELLFKLESYKYEAPFAYAAYWDGQKIGQVAFTLSYIEKKRALVVVTLQGKGGEGKGLYKKVSMLFTELMDISLYLVHPAYNHHTSKEKEAILGKPIRAPYSFYENQRGEERELVWLGIPSRMEERLFYKLYFVVGMDERLEMLNKIAKIAKKIGGRKGTLGEGAVKAKRLALSHNHGKR